MRRRSRELDLLDKSLSEVCSSLTLGPSSPHLLTTAHQDHCTALE